MSWVFVLCSLAILFREIDIHQQKKIEICKCEVIKLLSKGKPLTCEQIRSQLPHRLSPYYFNLMIMQMEGDGLIWSTYSDEVLYSLT